MSVLLTAFQKNSLYVFLGGLANRKLLGFERIGICKKCEFMDGKWCRVCGCYLPSKTQSRTDHCPIGKW